MRCWGILLVFMVLSCQDVRKIQKPDNLIPEQKMVEVLTDLSLINSAKNYNRHLLEQTGVRPGDYVYERHGIDSTSLAESTTYYAQNYDAFERIYTRVKENLEEMKNSLDLQIKEEQRVQDSINALGEKDSLNTQQAPVLKDSILDSIPDNRRIRMQ